MKYSWDKILAPSESIQKEFTISSRYLKAVTAVIIISALASAFVSFYAAFLIFILGFVYNLYLKVAKHYAFTSKRIILVDSFLGTTIVSIDYNQITDLEIEQSFVDQIGGWGTLIINTAGTRAPEIKLSFIDNPYFLKQQLDQIRDVRDSK